MRRDTTTRSASPDVPAIDRWRCWSGITLAVQLGTWIVYPALLFRCSQFHPIAVPVGLLPVAWGGFTLVTYRTMAERILGYINAAIAIGWLYVAWDSNLQYVSR